MKNEYKIVDVKGNLSAAEIERRIKTFDNNNTDIIVYEKIKDYVSIDIDNQKVDDCISLLNKENSHYYSNNEGDLHLNREQINLIIDWVLNNDDSWTKKDILEDVYSAIKSELDSYIQFKNGDTENYSCPMFDEVEKIEKKKSKSQLRK